jgi:hypothetical protein
MSRSLALGVYGAALVLAGTAAEARIECRDGFQVSGGREISTPYCNDDYLAKIARGKGYNVTADAVRNSPSLKNEICRWIGHDIRIRDYCPEEDGPDRGH